MDRVRPINIMTTTFTPVIDQYKALHLINTKSKHVVNKTGLITRKYGKVKSYNKQNTSKAIFSRFLHTHPTAVQGNSKTHMGQNVRSHFSN